MKSLYKVKEPHICLDAQQFEEFRNEKLAYDLVTNEIILNKDIDDNLDRYYLYKQFYFEHHNNDILGWLL